MASATLQNSVPNQPELVFRPSPNFSPSIWGDLFTSVSIHHNDQIIHGEEIEELKMRVRKMIVATETSMTEKLNLIDSVERLGISYHFEKEIEEQIQIFHNSYLEIMESDDLHFVALCFRLLRQHGCNISTGIFEKFRGNGGKFKKFDDEGMLSLYEAANVRTHGEDVLEEALVFVKAHLESVAPFLRSPLKEQVDHALEQCLHRGVPRVEARRYISLYEKLESRNDALLKLAKLDFNLLQMLHRQELGELSRWWKDLDLVSKLPYARDRMVECYFWTLGVYFEPHYSGARIMLAKTIAMISVIDDTYDSYGTIDELQMFTDAVQRWDMKEIERIPDYMKITYKALLELYDQYEQELKLQGRSFAVNYAKATMQEIVRSYNIEAKWFIEGYMPPFSEYMANGFITSTYYLLATTSFLGMASATNEAFNWLIKKPHIQVANATICRVVDDVATYEIEKKRGQSATGMECYMKDNGVSEGEAMEELKKMGEDAWKDMNGEIWMEKAVSMEILKRIVNLSRLIDVVYKNNEDGYTHPEKVLKPIINALLVDSLH
ncbi:vetispiradiene synthase 2-like [Salvia splendens]|uniref:vetispiradiene synthase 2-like n=1 Tax=Salvia splendens TaxID=180675 RepID=UPI00110551B2|nr:vetispiradiene synthase 2-like [Salvia splendens]